MKVKTVYVCEYCKNEYEIASEALLCEAKDLGLTFKEYEEYQLLLEREKQCGINVGIAKNERNEALFDEAVKAVIDFQKKHNITI